MPDEVLQRTPLALLGERGPAVLPVYELRMPKSLVGGLVDDVEPEPGGVMVVRWIVMGAVRQAEVDHRRA